MSKIKLLVEIEENYYYQILRNKSEMSFSELLIASGKPLPRFRGKLKDDRDIYEAIAEEYTAGRLSWGANEIIKDVIAGTRTIVEADKDEIDN